MAIEESSTAVQRGSMESAVEHSTTTQLLHAAAARRPSRTLFRVDGRAITFAEFAADCRKLAAGLASLGVEPGDRVAVFMHNSLACLQTWFASNEAGATWAPINTELRGPGLQHALSVIDPKVLVIDEELRSVPGLQLSAGRAMVIHGASGDVTSPEIRLEQLFLDDAPPKSNATSADTAALLFTSGTTGRSKACMLSHGYFHTAGRIFVREMEIEADDVLYCPFPLFHLDATALTTLPALLTGACAAIGRRFSASRFWDEVRDVGATVIEFMGATLTILHKQPRRADDADNPVRLAWGVPATDLATEFAERFGLQVVVPYGSTETNLCAVQRPSRTYPPGSCGQAVEEFEIRIAGPSGSDDAPPGWTGEILVRQRTPHALFDGYLGMPDATASALRGGWFHTDDQGFTDEAGNLYFVAREKDVIRRRGENISAFEVEEVLLQHPDVNLCAVIGVPSELSEEEVKAVIVLESGRTTTEAELAGFCTDLLARFQVPKYFEIVDDLPRTPTGKLEKHGLKEAPFGPRTWDRTTGSYVWVPGSVG